MEFSRQEYWSGLPPLGHKSGIFRREKKGNTYATSTHFPCSLQNLSNCKTVLCLRDPPTGHHSPSSSGYRGHAVSHRKTRCVFFKPWGSNLSQVFRIQFKGVRLCVEYHTAIKRNEFQLLLLRWINLELVMQSEVSQKEKNKYHILIHIYEI